MFAVLVAIVRRSFCRQAPVSARLMEADAETLWAEIRELVRNHDCPFAARILEVGEHEHWTVTHVALALAQAHMVLSNNHGQDLQEMMAFMNRPIVTNRHCPNRLRFGETGRFENRVWVPAADFREQFCCSRVLQPRGTPPS